MSKNDNINISKNQKKKLLDIEEKLFNEGIIFKRRLINKKENNNRIKRKLQHKNLSIKLTYKNIINKKLINSMRTNEKPFSDISHLSMNEFRKNRTKKNNSIKNNNKCMNNKFLTKSPNYSNKNILKYYSFNNNEKYTKT